MITLILLMAFCLFHQDVLPEKVDETPEYETGHPYKGWKEGELDIHHIYTGRGESSFLLFPDGTSLLIDAGDRFPGDYSKMCKALPDNSRQPGEWIARYIKKVNPFKNRVDYLLVSHFHSDHIGNINNNALVTKGRKPNYILSGIAEVGEYVDFNYLLDRGWPEYDYPKAIEGPEFENYKAFLEWKIKNNSLNPLDFKAGEIDQIQLQKNRRAYSSLFHVQNLVENGVVWDAQRKEYIRYFDKNKLNTVKSINENTTSIGIKITYGPFSYFTAGDLSGNLLNEAGNPVNVEEEVGKIAGPVNVCKANHHAFKDALTTGFLENIKASVFIVPVWDFEHIQESVLERIFSVPMGSKERFVFFTNLPDERKSVTSDMRWRQNVSPDDGHVVVKVLNGGTRYKIYVLSAEDEELMVKKIFGPFNSE